MKNELGWNTSVIMATAKKRTDTISMTQKTRIWKKKIANNKTKYQILLAKMVWKEVFISQTVIQTCKEQNRSLLW